MTLAKARQYIATAEAIVANLPKKEEPATLKLGVLNERLAPVRIDAAGLSALGFDPVKVEAGAKLYRESDFPRICAALVRHIGSVCEVVEA